MDARETELWGRAKEGEGDDLARLADYVGSVGLVERGADPALRATAVRALAFVHDFAALPWLASVGADRDDAEAVSALDAIVELASQPRRAVDPEDASELREGSDKLLALAKDTSTANERRVRAIRALRMLVDRHCVDPAQIPTDLDPR